MYFNTFHLRSLNSNKSNQRPVMTIIYHLLIYITITKNISRSSNSDRCVNSNLQWKRTIKQLLGSFFLFVQLSCSLVHKLLQVIGVLFHYRHHIFCNVFVSQKLYFINFIVLYNFCGFFYSCGCGCLLRKVSQFVDSNFKLLIIILNSNHNVKVFNDTSRLKTMLH